MRVNTLHDMMEAGKATGRAVRWWEEQGLLGTVERQSGGNRKYTSAQIERAQFIGAAQAAGYSLEQIRASLTYDEVRSALEMRRIEVHQWLDALPVEYDL